MLFPGVNALVSPDDVTREDSSEVGGRHGVTRDTALVWNKRCQERSLKGEGRGPAIKARCLVTWTQKPK